MVFSDKLPKLVSLGGYQKSGEAIHILNMEMGRTKPTKMKYIHDVSTEFQILNSIRVLCPGDTWQKNWWICLTCGMKEWRFSWFYFSDLQSVYLNSPINGLLKHITNFPKLRKVKLSKVQSEDNLRDDTPVSQVTVRGGKIVGKYASLCLHFLSRPGMIEDSSGAVI